VVAAEMAECDARDAARDKAPSQPAEVAVRLDTTALDADGAFARAMKVAGAGSASV